jgi:hypothetical protein
MPRIPGFPERPHYNSVKAYLLELAKDVAGLVVDPVKMERFREQLKIYAGFWQKWKIAEDADQNGCWKPEMGRPECVFNVFSRSYFSSNEPEKETKRLAGSYALCALIHDSQLPHLDKINTDIIPAEAVEEMLSAPRNTLEDRIVGNWNSGPDVREIYLIEDFFNMVNVDLQEFCKSEENKLTQASIERQIQQASQFSDEDFLELTAKKFEERAKKVLSKDETWHDLNRLLKGWFDAAVERLKKLDFTENEIGLLKYHYKNLLHYTRGITIKSFRGFPDSRIKQLASNQASELVAKFKDFAQRAKVSLKNAKAEIPVISKENEFGTIVELIQKDYLLENEDNLKQKIAEIVQDFISRGLANSTACVSKQLQVHFEHNNKLIDHIIESLKQDFVGIPLANFKEKLLTIVDEEYKKLIPFANSCLVNAGLAQWDMLSGYENTINNNKQKAKQIIETAFAISEKQEAATEDKRDGANLYEGHAIRVSKPWYKKVSATVIALIIFLAALTTLILNFDKIIEGFRGATGKETHSSKPFNESKLDISLRTICRDIDSRPLAQRSDTAKQYVGIRIEEERLKLLDINKDPERDTYFLSMVFPDQSDTSYSTGRRILCDIPKEQHPELNLAKQGVELYISGQIKEAGARYIKLSDVSLRFE